MGPLSTGRALIVDDVFDSLRQHLPTRCLLPGLRELDWDEDYNDVVHISLLLSPSLYRFSVKPTQHSLLAILDAVYKKAPDLKSLYISPPYTISKGTTLLLSQRCALDLGRASFTSLVKFSSSPQFDVSGATLVHLSSIPYLRHLTCHLSDEHLLVLSSLRNRQAFINLESLLVYSLSLKFFDLVIEAIAIIHSPHFHQLTIYGVRYQPRPAALHRLFEAVAQCSNLDTFSIHVDAGSDQNRAPEQLRHYLASESTLAPLFSLHSLQHITITKVNFDLTNESVARMVDCWPRLRSLELGGAIPYTRPRMTLEALRIIAARARDLDRIALHLDATKFPKNDPSTSINLIPHLPMTYLNLGPSLIEDARLVVPYLLGHFPHLSTSCSSSFAEMSDEESRIQSLWIQVGMVVADISRRRG